MKILYENGGVALSLNIDLAKLLSFKYLIHDPRPLPVNFVFIDIDDTFYTSEGMFLRLSTKVIPIPSTIKYLEVDDNDDQHNEDDSTENDVGDGGDGAAVMKPRSLESRSKHLESQRAMIANEWLRTQQSQMETMQKMSKQSILEKVIVLERC
jgi:hypothetical protein